MIQVPRYSFDSYQGVFPRFRLGNRVHGQKIETPGSDVHCWDSPGPVSGLPEPENPDSLRFSRFRAEICDVPPVMVRSGAMELAIRCDRFGNRQIHLALTGNTWGCVGLWRDVLQCL
jgi:hypothetical protein